MGFTERSAGFASFNKGVISIWSRVPSDVLSTALGLPVDPDDGWYDWAGYYLTPPLYATIPLLTFGSLEQTLPGSSVGDALPINPSFIGVVCNQGDGKAYLSCNLQTTALANCSPATVAPELEYSPARFIMSGKGVSDGDSLIVLPDQWHHTLISFDISPTSSIIYYDTSTLPSPAFTITPGPTFDWAFDDVHKPGSSKRPCGGENFDLGDQYILPQQILHMGVPGDYFENDFTIEVASCQIAQSGNPIGLPSSTDFATSVRQIQLAEVQIFTDVTLDLSVEDNRRAFIKENGHPEAATAAAALLGKEPEVYFQTHTDWISGNNRGTAGAFTGTGTILPYTPAP